MYNNTFAPLRVNVESNTQENDDNLHAEPRVGIHFTERYLKKTKTARVGLVLNTLDKNTLTANSVVLYVSSPLLFCFVLVTLMQTIFLSLVQLDIVSHRLVLC